MNKLTTGAALRWLKSIPMPVRVKQSFRPAFAWVRKRTFPNAFSIIVHGNQRLALREYGSDKSVFTQVFEYLEYAPLLDLIKRTDNGHQVRNLLDAGANIGLATIYLCEGLPTIGSVAAIEPDKDNVKIMRQNVKLAGIRAQVSVMETALWHEDNQPLELHSDFRDGQDWSKTVKLSTTKTGSVTSVSLSAIMEIMKWDRIDILKMDIEGAEAVLFRSSVFVEILYKHVRYLALEIHDEFQCRSDIERILHEHQFEFFTQRETLFARNKRFA